MVGVPGKSKGCNTCRRRKIRCDLGKPTCDRCAQSGRECEGYERFPTFLNRNAQGLQRRKPLEEAKSRRSTLAESSSARLSQAQQQTALASAYASQGGRSSPLGQPDAVQQYERQIFATFMGVYCPATVPLPPNRFTTWFHLIPTMEDPGDTLRHAAKALAASRVAFVYNDPNMKLRAYDAYGKALRELQKALWDPNAMYRDETLAAARALVAFELFETTSNSMRSWNSHESGTARLVQMRGAHRHQAPAPRAILEGLRFTSMIQSIQYRKASFLGSEEWLTIPWLHSPKDIKQRLYDIGFRIAGTLEGVDRLAETQNAEEKAFTFTSSLTRFSQIDTDLDNWYHDFSRQFDILYWTLPPEDAYAIDPNNPLGMESLAFPDIDTAHLMTAFWALKLTTSMIISQMCTRFMTEAQAKTSSPFPPPSSHAPGPAATDPSPQQPQSSSTPSAPLQLTQIVSSMLHTYTASHRFSFGARIARSVPFFLRDDHGLFAAHLILMPIRVALYEFQDARPGVDFPQPQQPADPPVSFTSLSPAQRAEKERLLQASLLLYDRLIESKGVGYARQVGRTGNRWGRPMPRDVDRKIESGEVDPTIQPRVPREEHEVHAARQQQQQQQSGGGGAEEDDDGGWREARRQEGRERPEFTSPVLERGWNADMVMGSQGTGREGGEKMTMRREFAYLEGSSSGPSNT